MMHWRQPRRLTIWIACLAILLNALAPSLSYAMYALSSQPESAPVMMEVCTANGTHLLDAAAAHSDDNHKKPLAAAAHCAFCLPHHVLPFLPPTATSSFSLPTQQGLMPPLFYQSPQPLFSWATAHPRGPPAVS